MGKLLKGAHPFVSIGVKKSGNNTKGLSDLVHYTIFLEKIILTVV